MALRAVQQESKWKRLAIDSDYGHCPAITFFHVLVVALFKQKTCKFNLETLWLYAPLFVTRG